MKLTKEYLEKMYQEMSIDDMALHLKMAKSTLYYNMKKLGVTRRSKSEAQKVHLKHSDHQRLGKEHSEDTKNKISNGTRVFWESDKGLEQKQKLGELRKAEWENGSSKYKTEILARLQTGEKPGPGSLSKFGKKLASFLEKKETVKVGVKLSANHTSDIILPDHKVVIELLLPTHIYGEKQENRIETRYNRLSDELNDLGYRVMIVEDLSNSISNARCQRIYEQLTQFFQDVHLQKIHIVS